MLTVLAGMTQLWVDMKSCTTCFRSGKFMHSGIQLQLRYLITKCEELSN